MDAPSASLTTDVSAAATRNPIEQLSREELLNKYKGLLGIAKKAKQAKDELTEENRQLKMTLSCNETQMEADKKALLTMKEILEEFTENKLQLKTQLNEMENSKRNTDDAFMQLQIEKEALQRQVQRISEDNDALLSEIDNIEHQLKQVNLYGLEQKKHLELLELEVNKLKATETLTNEENKALKESENIMSQKFTELVEKNKRVKQINAEQRQKFNMLKDRFVDLHRKLKIVKDGKRILLETQHEYAEAVSKWQMEIVEASKLLCTQMNALKRENEDLAQKLKDQSNLTFSTFKNVLDVQNVSKKIQELHALSISASEEQKAAKRELQILRDENHCLRMQLNKELPMPIDKKTNEQIDIYSQKVFTYQCPHTKLVDQQEKDSDTTFKALQSKNFKFYSESMACRIAELEQLCVCAIAEQSETPKALQALKTEHGALNKHVQQVAHKKNALAIHLTDPAKDQQDIINLREQLERCQHEYDVLAAEHKRKQHEHTDLLDEMRELNEALKARGDMISRQQVKQHDLVAELRETTIKLNEIEENLSAKEKIIETKIEEILCVRNEILVASKKITELEMTCTQNDAQIRALTDELQCMKQATFNSTALVDVQSDGLSTSTISRADEVNRMRDIEESYEEKYNKLRTLAAKMKRKMQEQTLHIEKLEKQQQEHFQINEDYSKLKQELNECKQRVATMQYDKEQQQKLIETLTIDLKKVKSSRKQVNVLSLEIEAAEKSLNETSVKLTSKIEELQMLNEILDTKENTIAQLRKEIAIVESAKQTECVHAKQLKDQNDRLQTQLKDAMHSKQQSLAENKQLEQSMEGLKLELEEAHIQLADGASQQETILSTLKIDRNDLQQKLQASEETLRQTHHCLNTTKRSLEDLRIEYLDYKVKAQAVLRKNQQKDASKETELEEEVIALRANETQLQSVIKTQNNRLETCDKELVVLQEDISLLQRRNHELLQVIDELRQQNEHLSQEAQSQLKLQQESLQNHRRQMASNNASYQTEITQLEASHRIQIEKLQIELSKIVRTPTIVGAAAIQVANANISDYQSKIDVLLMEREDAEGSEAEVAAAQQSTANNNQKISNVSQRRSHLDFMPLEELLNAPMHAITDAVMTTIDISDSKTDSNNCDSINIENAIIELQSTRDRLQIQDTRLRHLTALLAENEQDLAKLTQMNDMLKEELRKQERSAEREKHMHNSEYLKNVIIKFLTLNSADERAHLVPVLNTILKLNRTEIDLLQCAAKGQRSTSESQRGGWSNLLPSWGGGSSANNNPA